MTRYVPEVLAYLDRHDELSALIQSDGGFLEGPDADGAVAWIGDKGEAAKIRKAYDDVTGKTSSDKGGNDDRHSVDR